MNFKTVITVAISALVITACSNTNTNTNMDGNPPVSIPKIVNEQQAAPAVQPAEDAGFIGYVVRTDGNRMLVVSPEPRDFSANGGMNHFYEAIWFGNMPADIKLGMKVKVWSDGMINESYPAQGRAERAEVIASVKPEGAALPESEAIQKAISSYAGEGSFPVVTGAKYDPSDAVWTVSVAVTGSDATASIRVFDREHNPDMGGLYSLALDAFMPIDEGLNSGMEYIAVDMSNFEHIDDTDKQQILNTLSKYEVPVREATYEQLRAEEQSSLMKWFALKGILLRVDKVELSEKQMVLEGSKFKSGKGAMGTKVIVEFVNGKWQVAQANGTWIS
ncbi:YobA family protein [Paenibacillus kobensis]|uniref:YobA family protein n=1 Tax=Paenibacillus kobensis TaxID=59841 RepID=UPI0013E34D2F|nr:YobA family protein [Paenibacillus kobensis]